MRSTRSAVGLLALLPLALACAQSEANTPPPPPPAMTAEQAGAARTAYVEAMNKKDVATAAGVYANDAVFYAPDGSVVKGRAAIQASLEQVAPTLKTFALISERFEAGGDVAVDAGMAQEVMMVKGKEQSASSHYIAVFKRQADGGWKVMQVSQSPPEPVPAKK